MIKKKASTLLILLLCLSCLAPIINLVSSNAITTQLFNFNPSTYTYIYQDIANNINVTFHVIVGQPIGNGTLNANSAGGSLFVVPYSSGVLQVTASSAFNLYFNGVLSTTGLYTFSSPNAVTVTWSYASPTSLAVAVSPSSALMDIGQTLVFTASPSGGSGTYVSYQWYLNGLAQAGETASTYSYTPTANGTYYIGVTVTDSLGHTSPQSSIVQVTVNYAPTVSVSPYSSTIYLGDTQVFTASAANGSLPYLSYQWYVNGTLQPGQTGYTYSFLSTIVGSYSITAGVTDSTGITSTQSAAVTLTVYPASTTPTPTPTVPPVIIKPKISEKLYFRSDTYTTLNVAEYGLDTSYTNTPQTITETYSGSGTVTYAMQIYLFSSPLRTSQITSGVTTLFSVSGNFTGFESGTFNCPDTTVILGYQAFQINILQQYNGGAWNTLASYVSPVLITTEIMPSTWVFSLYVNNQQTGGNTVSSFSFGNSQYPSNINGVSLAKPRTSDIGMWDLQRGDIIGLILLQYLAPLGTAFYGLILFGISGVLWMRYKNTGVILYFFATLVSGGLMFVLLPIWAAPVAAGLILLMITFVFYRLVR